MGSGSSAGFTLALKTASQAQLHSAVFGLDNTVRKRIIETNNLCIYVTGMHAQWDTVLQNPEKVSNTAASKRSPFKFQRGNSVGEVDINLGVSTVALPDVESDFGKRYLSTIDKVQDLCDQALRGVCKRQTVPHMSIGSVLLDKDTPEEYNTEVMARTGMIAAAKAQLDGMDPPIRAKIQCLKINPDGCVTFQLEHDPAQDVVMSEAELDVALEKIPTCKGGAAAGEKRKFKKEKGGSFIVSRFQQVRLALGSLGCEIKGMYPSGHMVVTNLVNTKLMEAIPQEKLDELWVECYRAYAPLLGEWFELKRAVALCYVERSLNEGSVVVAPAPGSQPLAFPADNPSAQALLGGIFTANDKGDVLLDIKRFMAKARNQAQGQWQAFSAEVREAAENHGYVQSFKAKKPGEAMMLACFKEFDKDGSGSISTSELANVMEKLGEKLKDKELAEMIKFADKDGSGSIDIQEFVKSLAN